MFPTPTPPPSPKPTPAIIETVRVATGATQTTHKLPFAASALRASDIRGALVFGSDALIARLPGIDRDRSNSAFTNYGQLRVSLSGAGTDRGAVLADGIPAQDGFGGQIDWAAYPASDLERVELLRGPGSALYGSGAIGGALLLETISDGRAAALSAGSNAYANGSAHFTQRFVNGISASIALSQQHLSYRDLAPGYQSSLDTPANGWASMGRIALGVRSGATDLTYSYRGAWDVQQQGRSNYDFARNYRQHSLTFKSRGSNATLTGAIFARDVDITNRADNFPAKPGQLLYTQRVPTHETGANVLWTTGEHAQLTLRADARFISGVSNQYNPTNVITAAGSGVQYDAGLAAQQTLYFARGEIVAGVRTDLASIEQGTFFGKGGASSLAPRTDRALSPRFAIRYDLSHTLAFRASAGGGLRTPYLNELLRGYVIGATSYLPNPNLIPERSASLNAGFDLANERNELSLDYSHTTLHDAIGFVTASPTTQIRSNLSQTQTDGLTASLRYELHACSMLTVSGTAQHARVTSGPVADIGKQLAYVPKAAANASYDTQIGAITAGASVAYLGPNYADDLNLQSLGTALVSGVRVVVPLRSNAALILNAENLTGARYLSSIDRYGPPQLLSLGIQIGDSAHARDGCHS